jgi:lipopolysaccharide biosynthesis glycosyltransferase
MLPAIVAGHDTNFVTSPVREPVVVVCAADAHYAMPLGVMLQSVLVNLSPNRTAVFYIIESGVTASQKAELLSTLDPRRSTVHWIVAQSSSYSGVPLWGRMTVATYFRLGIANLLPLSVGKAIWLDCDLIVVGDLARLWDLDLSHHHVLAAQDSVVPLVSSPCGVTDFAKFGLAPDTKYFNAGVMVVDLALWRKNNVAERVLEHIRRHREEVFFMDQDGLNVILAGKWGALDPRWNYNASLRYRTGRIRGSAGSAAEGSDATDPWIIHFAGSLKPWLFPTTHPDRVLFYRYLDMTAWAGWRPKQSLRGRMIGAYEFSRLRSVLYPLEQRAMRLMRTLSLRFVPTSTDRAIP